MDLCEHLQKATIPWLKHICEEKGIKLNGSTKQQVTHVLLTYVGDDKEKEANVREMIDHLVRNKGNKVKENKLAKQKSITVQADVHQAESSTVSSANSGVDNVSPSTSRVGEVSSATSRVGETSSVTSRVSETSSVTSRVGETSSVTSRVGETGSANRVVSKSTVSEDSQDLFNHSVITQDTSSVSEPSDTGTLVEQDIRPKSTSSLRDSRGGLLSASESQHDITLDQEMSDDRVNRALTGQDQDLDDSVFNASGFIDESNIGRQKRHVHFSENEKDQTDGKLDLLVTMIVDMRKHFDREWAILKEEWETEREYNKEKKGEWEAEREYNKEKIRVLEENVVTLKQVNEKAMHQIKVLVEGKDKALEATQRQASQALETVQELSKAKTAQEAKVHANEARPAREKSAGKGVAKPLVSAGKGAAKPLGNGDHAAMRAKKAHQDIVLVVGDSNIDPLVSGRLHEAKEVRKLKRSTIKEAEENIAGCSNPENVTDIVIHIGSNDMRKGMTAREAKDGIGRIQSKYKGSFKKARFHIAALPPTSDKQEVNFHLRELAAEKKSNFISLKTMKDRQTRQPVAGTVQANGWSLTQKGTSILAAGIKRSLYSKANIPNEAAGLDISRLTQTVTEILSQA